MHNFQIANTDTDSISFCKPDGSFMPIEERKNLIKEINDLSPEFMLWADDGFYKKVIILKAKNYVLQKEDGSITYKGNSIKASTKEPALKEFIKRMIGAILEEKFNYVEIYNEYVKEIMNVKDMTRWVTRKTLSDTMIKSTRANETKVIEALKGTEYKEGDRFYTFFLPDDSQCLLENFKGEYSKDALLGKLFSTVKVFETIIDKKQFPNYTLKRNKKLLEELNAN